MIHCLQSLFLLFRGSESGLETKEKIGGDPLVPSASRFPEHWLKQWVPSVHIHRVGQRTRLERKGSSGIGDDAEEETKRYSVTGSTSHHPSINRSTGHAELDYYLLDILLPSHPAIVLLHNPPNKGERAGGGEVDRGTAFPSRTFDLAFLNHRTVLFILTSILWVGLSVPRMDSIKSKSGIVFFRQHVTEIKASGINWFSSPSLDHLLRGSSAEC